MNELQMFNANVLLTKQEIMDSFEEYYLKGVGNQEITENERKVFASLCEKFKFQLLNQSIKNIYIPWHFYEYRMNEDGLELVLFEADRDVEFDEDYRINAIDYALIDTIISVKAPYYTVQEFAKHHGVTDTTVKQWIQKGKIHNAKKINNEWKIPAITSRPEKGYTSGNYYYEHLPKEILHQYPSLENTSSIYFDQDDVNKDNFKLISYKNEPRERIEIDLSAKERENLELSLIESDEIMVDGVFSNFGYIPEKSTCQLPIFSHLKDEHKVLKEVFALEDQYERLEYLNFDDDFLDHSFVDYEDFFT